MRLLQVTISVYSMRSRESYTADLGATERCCRGFMN